MGNSVDAWCAPVPRPTETVRQIHEVGSPSLIGGRPVLFLGDSAVHHAISNATSHALQQHGCDW